jgi:hypothetical protein
VNKRLIPYINYFNLGFVARFQREQMKNFSALFIGLCIITLTISSSIFPILQTTVGDFTVSFSGMFKPEMFYGKNVSLLNNNNEGNKIWFQRHTLDLNFGIDYGMSTYGSKVASFFTTIRDRGIWGNPESIAATTEAETKILDAIGRRHRHAIPRHIFWIRECWLEFKLQEVMGLSLLNSHHFKIGLFPFELGRGIALGDAYNVGPELLGFYSESYVDQYAPGALFHGTILKNRLEYDLYAAILQNRSTTLSETGAAILGQEYGRRATPQRGSGKINFLIAARLMWEAFDHPKYGHLHVEPYALYNRDPEQRIEFLGDATSQLGTLGLALEYLHPKFEIGFDYAFNLGQQRVKGWDRNQIVEQNLNGQVVLVNSHVVDQTNGSIPFVRGNQAQQIIDSSFQDESQNNQIIGNIDGNIGYLAGPVVLKNAANRFRNPYRNKYEGWMFVVDGGVWAYKRDLLLAATAFITTGDDNPNEETIDATYSAFIPLQEIYSGKRVKSAFLLGGAGKLVRPLSDPATNQTASRFAQNINGFVNLVGCGAAAHWKPSDWEKAFALNPNVLVYWQEKPIKKFDAFLNQELDCLASTYLGVELNIFTYYMVLKDLKLFLVASVFLPGNHYRDIRGKPLNAAQKALLDRLDRTGFDQDRVPNIGNDTAYTFNLGLEFKF